MRKGDVWSLVRWTIQRGLPKWSDGYTAFNRAAVKAFNAGYTVTASFDLTACYDSIDHAVLRHFLQDIDLDNEFCLTLTSWLSKWTATERQIVQNHGIPQGPLGSGLLSEVVLRHFDDHRGFENKVRYFRYVDDIRLFAKRESDLRKMLIVLDRLSKDIGLFPQSSKINIHEVGDIRTELKTVSGPTERAVRRRVVAQESVRRRLVKLSPRYVIDDATRFKYELAHASPHATIASRMWRIYEREPQYYESFCRYLERYPVFPAKLSKRVLDEIGKDNLYQSVTAAFVRAACGRVADSHGVRARRLFKRLWKPRSSQPDLTAALTETLVQYRHLTKLNLDILLQRRRGAWVASQCFLTLDDRFRTSMWARSLPTTQFERAGQTCL
jgi:hypothetical protein